MYQRRIYQRAWISRERFSRWNRCATLLYQLHLRSTGASCKARDCERVGVCQAHGQLPTLPFKGQYSVSSVHQYCPMWRRPSVLASREWSSFGQASKPEGSRTAPYKGGIWWRNNPCEELRRRPDVGWRVECEHRELSPLCWLVLAPLIT